MAVALRRLHQPPVIGEMLAGLALGPSLLGRWAPEWSAQLLSPGALPALSALAQVGVLLFLFTVGLELDLRAVRAHARQVLTIAEASLLVPFVAGVAVAVWLYPRFGTADVPFLHFALFCGLSLSVTAFPVLARILTDMGLHATRLGTTALACAAVADVVAWCALAVVVGLVRADVSHGMLASLGALVYALVLLTMVRPLVRRWAAAVERTGLTPSHLGVLAACVLASAYATEAVGVHALFGAFLFGAVVPHDSRLAREAHEKVQGVVVVVFLPVYFAFTGLRTQVGLLADDGGWRAFALIVAIATLAKIGSGLLAGRINGLGWREAGGLGVLLNTRGLMELVVLNMGLDLGLITPRLFAVLVLMAIVTTCGTAPLLHLLGVVRRARSERAEDVVMAGAAH